MKTLFVLFACLFLSHLSAQQKQNNSLLAYIEQTYVKPSKQKLELLEKDKKNNQKEFKEFSQKLELLKQKLIKNQKEIEVSKLWPLYFKAICIYNHNLEADEKQKAKAQEFMNKIKQKYKDITSKDFPDLEAEYKAK